MSASIQKLSFPQTWSRPGETTGSAANIRPQFWRVQRLRRFLQRALRQHRTRPGTP